MTYGLFQRKKEYTSTVLHVCTIPHYPNKLMNLERRWMKACLSLTWSISSVFLPSCTRLRAEQAPTTPAPTTTTSTSTIWAATSNIHIHHLAHPLWPPPLYPCNIISMWPPSHPHYGFLHREREKLHDWHDSAKWHMVKVVDWAFPCNLHNYVNDQFVTTCMYGLCQFYICIYWANMESFDDHCNLEI